MNWKLALRVAGLTATLLFVACKPTNNAPSDPSANVAVLSSLKFQGLDVGRTIDTNRAVPPLTMFASDDKIIASVRTDGIAKSVPISVKLIAMKNGQVLSELRQKVTTTGPATTNFEFPNSTPRALGRYLVEATINDKLDARQEIEVRQDGPPDPNSGKQESQKP